MKDLRRLVAISILIISLFGVALADGGDTHGPPAPPCTADCPSTQASASEASTTEATPALSAQAPSVDVVTEVTSRLGIWLEAAIF